MPVAPFVLGWVPLRMDLLSALCVLCVLRARAPPYALMMHAFVGRVEGKRALHLPLSGVDVVARRARHLVACSKDVACGPLQQLLGDLFRSGASGGTPARQGPSCHP